MMRRSFLKVAGAGGFALGVVAACARLTKSGTRIPLRELGRTGRKIPIIGFPGLGLVHDEQPACTEAIRAGIDAGVNYLDVAPAYGKGLCETRMGIGLEGVPRDSYFLACKTKVRDAAGARQELENSLRLLKTDHFDLYQLHCLQTSADVNQALGPGGAMEDILKAKQEGKVGLIGFSAHTTKAAIAAMKRFQFDTVMFPINYVEYFKIGFGKEVLALANEQGASVLAIKPMCGGGWPEGAQRTRKWWYRPLDDPAEQGMALRFTLSQPGVVAGIPPAWPDIFRAAIQAAAAYRPITTEETAKLEAMAAATPSVFEKQQQVTAADACAYPENPFGCGHEAAV